MTKWSLGYNFSTHLCSRVCMSISYDMGWQKKIIHIMSSTYSALSGYGFVICLRTKNIMSMIIYSKICQTCQIAKVNNKKISMYGCLCIYECRLKSTVSDWALTLLKRCYNKYSVYFKHIVSNDNSTARSLLKRQTNGGWYTLFYNSANIFDWSWSSQKLHSKIYFCACIFISKEIDLLKSLCSPSKEKCDSTLNKIAN